MVKDADISAFIDIFVWDYISGSSFWQWLKVTALRTLQGMMKKDVDYSTYGLKGKILVGTTQALGKLLTDNMKRSLLSKIQTGFAQGKKEYIHKSNDSYKGCGEIFDKGYMDEYTEIELEGREYMVSKRYREELITSYGADYMTPPAEKDRCPSHVQLRGLVGGRN